VLYDNMKTVILERDAYGEGEHRYHAGFLDYARHCGFVIKLCLPYRAKTKGKVERFNGYLRRSFYIPLVAQAQASRPGTGCRHRQCPGANLAGRHRQPTPAWHHRRRPAQRLIEERSALQPLPPAWRGDIAAARPQAKADAAPSPQSWRRRAPSQRPGVTSKPINLPSTRWRSTTQLLDTLRAPREVAP
jgi:hypothetical protein